MNSKKLNILIIEDDYITQKSIEKNLTALGHSVKGRAMYYDKAITILNQEKIDFAIIDINIKGEKKGTEIGTYITNHIKIPFVYLTAYSDPKTINSAIETEPYGYLVKPFQQHDLLTSIEIALINFNKEKNNTISAIIQIKIADKNIKLNLDSILFVESDKNYVKIYTKKETYKYRNTLHEFQEKLPGNFIQTHKSFLVNTNYISTVSKNIIEIEEFKIPISKSYKAEMDSFLNDFK